MEDMERGAGWRSAEDGEEGCWGEAALDAEDGGRREREMERGIKGDVEQAAEGQWSSRGWRVMGVERWCGVQHEQGR